MSAHQAVKRVQSVIKSGRKTAVDVDLSKFFDRVNHDLLMTEVRKEISDKRLLRIIGRYLRAGVIDNQFFKESREGVPQGGPLSPLLANIMLDPLDKELEKRGHPFARYADDFIILVKSQRAGERVMRSISLFLEKRLMLQVNPAKSQVVDAAQCSFLGFAFLGKQIGWAPKALKHFKHNVRQLTNRNWGVSMGFQIAKISQYLRGWINYFGIAHNSNLCAKLDHWIRRRVRMAYWRQWRKPRTKVGNLLRRGVHRRSAIVCGISSKGPWRNSRTPGINQALSDSFLASQGLVSLLESRATFHQSV
jgi:RNA-directed DNA polymerase